LKEFLESNEWICERQTEGTILGLKVKKWLVREKTAYQSLELALTEEYGLALTLDGCFMLTEKDEHFYHEMLVHPALLSHPQPRRVLIVGGGDGGALREVLKHPEVEAAFLVEIDEEVVTVARRFLKSIHAGSFDDKRTSVVIAPGEEFVKGKREDFDIIIIDSTDPVGPGRKLFEPEFYTSCHQALKPGGIIALQAGTPFHHPEELTHILQSLKKLFPSIRPYLGFMPTYPSGMWAYVLAGLRDLAAEERFVEGRFRERRLTTRYYTPRLHSAAFVLPRSIADLVNQSLSQV